MTEHDYATYSDLELIQLIKEDDVNAFKEIYNRFFGLLYVHACKKIDDNEAVKDILQDIFASIWNNRTQLFIQHSFSSYMYTAIRYKIISYYQSQNISNQYLESLLDFVNREEPVQTDYLVRESELNELIEKEVKLLPPSMRRIFIMSRFEHLAHKEIASELNLSEHTVKTQVKRALRILKGRLPWAVFLYFMLK